MSDESKNRVTTVGQKGTPANIQRGLGLPKSGGDSHESKSNKDLLHEQKKILKMIPLSPAFFGKSVKYKTPSPKDLRKAESVEIGKYRGDVSQFAVRHGICHSREAIQKNLKAFPFHAELNAINAILSYTDAQEGGQDKDKLDLLHSALIEIGMALHNGADSVFNITWFIKIYLAFISALSDRINRLLGYSRGTETGKLAQAIPALRRAFQQLKELMRVKEKVDAHAKLQDRVKGTLYLISPTTPEELKESCKAMLANDEKKIINSRKRANYILYISTMTLQLLSSVPIMNLYTEETLKNIPEVHRDLVLRKRMFVSNMQQNDFLLSMAANDMRAAREHVNRIYVYSTETIKEYLENALLMREYEADPFMRAGWVIREAKNLAIERTVYKKQLSHAKELLKIVLSDRCKYNGFLGLARDCQYDINRMLEKYE